MDKYMYTYFTGHKTILEVINIIDLVAVSLVTKMLRKGEFFSAFYVRRLHSANLNCGN